MGLSYDAQGNLKNRNGQNYDFDFGNRLREVTSKEYYRYDGNGRRVMAWEPVTGSILSQYTQDGRLFYQEDQRTGARLFNLYLGDNLVAIREVTTQLVTKYQHTDALGSPVAVTNEIGQVVERNDYEPYGSVINQPNYGGIGFTGHVQDAATGLTYMQQRYYDPQVGLFLSVDPVEAHSGGSMYFNRYRYAAGNPYKFIDPDGRRNGRANPNPSYIGLTRLQREKLAGIIARKYGIDTGGRDIHAFDGGAGAQPTAQGLRIWEGQFVSESMLAATLGHEFEKHYDEHIKNNGYGENWEDEIDAYEYNLENAGRFGNTPEEVQGFKDQINTYKERIRERKRSDEPRRKEEPKRDREAPERTR